MSASRMSYRASTGESGLRVTGQIFKTRLIIIITNITIITIIAIITITFNINTIRLMQLADETVESLHGIIYH